jgi:hypothetical protein
MRAYTLSSRCAAVRVCCAGDLQVDVIDGQLVIRSDTGTKKFIPQVEHRTFSGSYAVKRGQPVLYVTERCVFQLTADGLELTDVAPGVDIERDILARMDFEPIIRGTPKLMDAAIFDDGPMDLRTRMLEVPLADRFSYDDQVRNQPRHRHAAGEQAERMLPVAEVRKADDAFASHARPLAQHAFDLVHRLQCLRQHDGVEHVVGNQAQARVQIGLHDVDTLLHALEHVMVGDLPRRSRGNGAHRAGRPAARHRRGPGRARASPA